MAVVVCSPLAEVLWYAIRFGDGGEGSNGYLAMGVMLHGLVS